MSERCAQVKALGVVAANDHRESIFETERLGDCEIETLGVELLHALVDGDGIAGGRFVEDGGEGGAGVFDVEIDVAGEQSFVDEESAAEIGFALDVDAGARFDVLGEEFGEDDLFGEKFGADRIGDVRVAEGSGQEDEVEAGRGRRRRRRIVRMCAIQSGRDIGRREFNTCSTQRTQRGRGEGQLSALRRLDDFEAAFEEGRAGRVGEDGQERGGNGAGEDDGVADHGDAAEDEGAEAACADGCGDGGDADGDDGGGANAGKDDRKREGKADARKGFACWSCPWLRRLREWRDRCW